MKTPHSTLLWLLLALASALGATAQDNWTDKSPHKTEFITVNSVRLHYLDWGGKGETMLFLHGLGDTPHIFDDLALKFTNQFRVLGLTRRGHGQSEMPETGYDTATLVEDIRQFLDALKIERVVLVGHSIAGDELSRFAVVHPDRVTKLVYLDAAYDRTRMPELNKQYPPELSATKTDIESLDNMRRWLKRMNNSWSEAWEASLREQFSSDGKTFLNAAEKGRAIHLIMEGTFESHADYAKIQAPALSFFVVGYNKIIDFVKALPDPARKNAEEYLSRATQFTHQEIEHFRNEIPNGKIIVFTNTDHHCFISREDEVVREMRQFLAH
jgi:pimeloyl-ACP methyl ester carboxylesterase